VVSENIPRMLPKELAAEVDVATWNLQPIFTWLKKVGNISSPEFARTFNTGLGIAMVTSEVNLKQVISELEGARETVFQIGRLVKREAEGCILKNIETWD
jgi:phosphoribosylamine--glycine ligase/phosphoribosylformylglycinamidine cyclo-ligase